MPTWNEITTANPRHSHNYADRWDRIAASGQDIVGEARLVDAVAERGSTIIDAGCGTGRLANYLAQAGHRVIGIDIDPHLIAVAKDRAPHDAPGTVDYAVADLCDPFGYDGQADIVLAAGNVMGFISPQHRDQVLHNIAAALKPGGLFIAGVGANRGWPFDTFFAQATDAGMKPYQVFSTWQMAPFTPDSGFVVALVQRV